MAACPTKLVPKDDICDLTNSQSEDEREDAAFDRALAPAGVAQAVNQIKTEAELEALIAGVVMDAAPALPSVTQAPSEFDFGTIFDELVPARSVRSPPPRRESPRPSASSCPPSRPSSPAATRLTTSCRLSLRWRRRL
jgi:hypothetical protein